MKPQSLAAVAILAVAAAAGGHYYLGSSSNRTEAPVGAASAANGPASQSPLTEMSTAPISDEINFETQAAAINEFQGSGSRGKANRYLAELKEAVMQGKGAFYLSVFATYYPRFGMSRDERDTYLASLPVLSEPQLKAIVEGWRNEVKLRSTPFEFAAPTLEGESFDLASLRGKVVLVDYWDTGCSACIEAMPRIATLHKKYKDRGFEVVSIVSRDSQGNLDLKGIKRIERKVGATWPTLNGSNQWDQLAATYGYPGKPQYMLLGRKGQLLAHTGEVDLGRNLEPLLQKYL